MEEAAKLPTVPVLGQGSATEASFNLTANAAPTNISLSSTSVDEQLPAGTGVGAISSTDENTGDDHSYSLVPGSGDEDNSSFTIQQEMG